MKSKRSHHVFKEVIKTEMSGIPGNLAIMIKGNIFKLYFEKNGYKCGEIKTKCHVKRKVKC